MLYNPGQHRLPLCSGTVLVYKYRAVLVDVLSADPPTTRTDCINAIISDCRFAPNAVVGVLPFDGVHCMSELHAALKVLRRLSEGSFSEGSYHDAAKHCSLQTINNNMCLSQLQDKPRAAIKAAC